MATEGSRKEGLKTETQKTFFSSMRHGIGNTLNKLTGRQWTEKQIRTIANKVFDNVRELVNTERTDLTFEELYIAVLLVYNDINKFLPRRHIDPPPKEKVKELKENCDRNFDGGINREEFANFIMELTSDAFIIASKGLVIALIVAPAIAVATKRATEGVPGIGRVVQKLPNSIYACLVTLVLALLQKLYRWT